MELKAAIDKVLIDGLTQELKDTCDRLLARGKSKSVILTAAKACANMTEYSDPNMGKLTIAAVEAYLASKT